VPDQFITFIFPLQDRKQPAVERDFTWDAWGAMPEAVRPSGKNYTVRHWRPETNEVDVDMVFHEGSTVGTDWARATEPGDRLAIWGPRVAFDPPADTEWLLLFGDDTALPGICVILENLPIHQHARVIVEVDSEADMVPLVESDRIDVTWLFRNGQEPGNKEQLVSAIQALEIPDLPAYAWGGGEVRTMNAIGKYLRRTVGFRPTDVCAVGYWNANSQ
jgi:NADPH-dependent ferric siderophore reductase